MKKTLFLLLAAVLMAQVVSAITLNQPEGFENSGQLPPNWNRYQTSGTVNWTMSITDPMNGTYHAQANAPGTSSTTYLEANLSTAGYAGVNVTYYRKLVGLDGPDEFSVEWYNGTTWFTLEATGANTANDVTYQYRNYTLPTGAGDNPNFKLRFGCMAGAVSEFCRVDNVTIFASVGANPVEPVDEVTYQQTIVNNTNGSFSIIITPMYNNSGVMTPINTTLTTSTEPGFEAGRKGLYEAHFKDLVSTTTTILIRRGIEIAYDPNSLLWDSSTGTDIIDANPGGNGNIDSQDPSSYVYQNAYGTGLTLKYTYEPGQLKEYLIINNRSNLPNPSSTVAAGQNLSLRLDFALHNVNDADLYVDESLWTAIGEIDAQTAKFRYNGKDLLKLAPVIAFDSAGNNVSGKYHFRRTVGDLWVEVRIPFSWLNDTNRVYPVYVDPTTYIDENGHLHINLSDETYHPLSEIELFNITGEGSVEIDLNVPNANYAINPLVDFESGVVITKNSTGDYLLKCPSWNFTHEYCGTCIEWNNGTCVDTDNDVWMYVESITPGQLYSFNIYPGDPAYYEASSVGESTTTLSTPQNKTILNVTTTAATTLYAVLFSSEVSGASAADSVYSDIVINNVPYMANYEEPKDTSATNFYPSRYGLWTGNLSAGNHTIRTTYYTGLVGTTARIRNSNIVAIELPPTVSYYQNLSNVSYTTSLVERSRMDFTVNTAQPYWIFGTAVLDSLGTMPTQMRVDGVAQFNTTWIGKDTRDYTGFFGQRVMNLSAGNHNVSIWSSSTLTGGDWMRDFSFIAYPLGQENYFYNETYQENTTTSVTYVNHTVLTFNVPSNGEYIFSTTSSGRHAVTNQNGAINLVIDGVQVCEGIREPNNGVNYYPFGCIVSRNLTAGQHTAVVQYKASAVGNPTHIRQSSILVFAKVGKNCNPTLNVDWVITDAQVCDNVNRTTGTGRINITSTGNLTLINNATITSSGFGGIFHNGFWKVLIQRGSRLFITR